MKLFVVLACVLVNIANVSVSNAADSPRAGNADGNPAFLQSRFGSQGNFELAVPAAGTGVLYYWRDNDHDMFWNGPDAVFTDAGHFDALAMIQSNYGNPGNMELIARRGDRLSFMFRDGDPATPWHGVWDIASGVAGTPAFVQSNFGSQGNFEVVVPSAGNGLLHFWRDNDRGMSWNGPVAFFQNWGHFDAVTLIQSNYGQNFEGIARRGNELYFFFHDTDWHGPWLIGTGARGDPVLFQSRYGSKGNFELAVPSVGGGVDYYWRDNDHQMKWNGPYRLFGNAGMFDALSMIQSNYGSPGNFEMVLRQGQALRFAFRVDRNPWQGPFPLSEPTDPAYFVEGPPLLRRGYTDYLGSFSNNPIQHQAAVGITGTDLGVAFEAADGQLAFLFGDSWTPGGTRNDQDSITATTQHFVDRWTPAWIHWATNGAGQFAAMNLSSINGGGMNVPLDGIALFGRNYVFFNSDWHTFCGAPSCPGAHGTLALGVMGGINPATLQTGFVISTQRFTNVSVSLIGDYVYIYGAGEPYRYGAVYLARVPAQYIDQPPRWEYYRGVRDGIPVFGPGEGTAVPLFSAGWNWSDKDVPLENRQSRNGIGEFSVRMHNGDKMIMTYAAPDGAPLGRGIYLRTAPAPWGPWSAPELLLSAGDIYGRWQHQSPSVGYDDGLGEYNRREEWGGEYGPYLVPRWFDHYEQNEFGIVYTLSSWNPYQSHLIRSLLTTDGHAVSSPDRGTTWPKASLVNGDFASGDTRGWVQVGGPFPVFRANDGRNRVTTFGANGDATIGRLYQDVNIDSNTTAIKFKIHGGRSQVKLIRTYNMEAVRAVHGLNDNANEIEVRWDVRDYQGENMRIQIEDQETGPWGFIGAGWFEVQ